jgi:3-dehydroquinate synthase
MTKTLQKSGLEIYFIKVPDTEKSKSFYQCSQLIKKFAFLDRGKGIFIIAFGGGVIGDLAGFAASVYKRGVPYIQIPTTFLAQVDSSIGGKVAIDLPCGKNLVGSFYQPRLVLSDINFLHSLKKIQIRQALAEVIKYAIIADSKLFKFLEINLEQIFSRDPKKIEYIVKICSQIKAQIVEQDETDKKDKRIILNFGHTTAHALETTCGYKFNYPHGESVALGMLVACEIAKQLKIISTKTVDKIATLIIKAHLPTKISDLKISNIIQAQAYDKKIIGGKNRFVLPVRIGKVIIKEDVPQHIIAKAIKSIMVKPKSNKS